MRTPSARTRLQLTRWLVQHDFRGDRNDLLCHFPPSSILSSYGPTPRCVKALTKQANLFGQVEEEEERLRALTFSFTLESEGRRLDVRFVLFFSRLYFERNPPSTLLFVCSIQKGTVQGHDPPPLIRRAKLFGALPPLQKPTPPTQKPLTPQI